MRAKFINESHSDLLDQFEKMLRQHDWYYMMSDDPTVYRKGEEELREIKEMIKKLADEGQLDAAEKIWKKIAPKSPMSNKQMSFPGIPKKISFEKPKETSPKTDQKYNIGDKVLVNGFGGVTDRVVVEITEILEPEFNRALNTYYGRYLGRVVKSYGKFTPKEGEEIEIKEFNIKEKR